MADTGLRRAEIAGMKLADLDLANNSITVRDTKNGSSRSVNLTDRVVGAILRYLKALGDRSEPTGHLWLVPGTQFRPLTPGGLGQMIAKRGKAAGVDVRAHAFRRRHAGEWMKRGGSEVGLQTNSEWKSTAMIARYTKDTQEANARDEARRLFDD